ncbi:MAG: hypothetical protein ACI87E_004438, partial [Mariniblastus sp.]
MLSNACAAESTDVSIRSSAAQTYLIQNSSLARELSVANGTLQTKSIENKLAETKAVPTSCDEFRLRISAGTHTTGTDVTLTSTDFTFKSSDQYIPAGSKTAKG